MLQTSFHKQGFGAGAMTTKEAHACLGGSPAVENHAQFVIVVPAIADKGIVKFTSKYRHCVGRRVEVSVTVTIFPESVAFNPDETAPIEIPVSGGAGIVSVMVMDVIGKLPLLHIHI